MSIQNEQITEKKEKNDIVIRSRKHIDISGVTEVISFDENSVAMLTVCGEMALEGEALKIGVLDTDRGMVSVDGKISAVIYYDESPAPEKRKRFGGLFSR